MQIKQFNEPDMRKAMRRVRKTLGADAVILETRETGTGIEITAAVDYDPVVYQRDFAPQAAGPAAATDGSTRDWLMERADSEDAPAVAAAADTTTAVTAVNAEISALREEVTNVRALLESQVSRLVWDEKSRRTPELTRVMRNLTGLGVTADVVNQLTGDIDADTSAGGSWTIALRKLVGSIPVSSEDVVMAGGIFAVIGPTGAGKTTSIAKLAARYALRRSAEDIALVTTDTFRIGARAQLETFGEILDTPVYQAHDAASLSDTLRNLSHKQLVLIDTAGMGA
ncbi:MAG: flagellar biosynthesis protein FlhF, partial [Gammaproteobacteria bacterium]